MSHQPRQSDPLEAFLARFGPPPGNSAIIKRIRSEIERAGPISFARFMELALYEPELGYYVTDRPSIGAAGDFATSPEVHPVFGGLIAAFAVLVAHDCPEGPVRVVEVGAGTGSLAGAFVAASRQLLPGNWSYEALEMSPALRALLRRRLSDHWPGGNWTVLPPGQLPHLYPGLVVANELLDALPFHRVVRRESRWMELRVGTTLDALVEVEAPIEDAELTRLATRLPAVPPGTAAEVGVGAVHWLEATLECLACGGLLLTDYGDATERLVSASRPTGTVRTFHQHVVGSNPFVRIGQQDITASVDFGLMAEVAVESGASVDGPLSQAEFLGRLLATDAGRRIGAALASSDPAKLRHALEILQDPQGFGAYQCLFLSRGIADGAESRSLFR